VYAQLGAAYSRHQFKTSAVAKLTHRKLTHDHAKRVKIPFELSIVSAKNRRLKRYLQQ